MKIFQVYRNIYVLNMTWLKNHNTDSSSSPLCLCKTHQYIKTIKVGLLESISQKNNKTTDRSKNMG